MQKNGPCLEDSSTPFYTCSERIITVLYLSASIWGGNAHGSDTIWHSHRTRQHKSMSLSSEKSLSIVIVHKLKNTSSNHSKEVYQLNMSRSKGAWECDNNIMEKSLQDSIKAFHYNAWEYWPKHCASLKKYFGLKQAIESICGMLFSIFAHAVCENKNHALTMQTCFYVICR